MVRFPVRIGTTIVSTVSVENKMRSVQCALMRSFHTMKGYLAGIATDDSMESVEASAQHVMALFAFFARRVMSAMPVMVIWQGTSTTSSRRRKYICWKRWRTTGDPLGFRL